MIMKKTSVSFLKIYIAFALNVEAFLKIQNYYKKRIIIEDLHRNFKDLILTYTFKLLCCRRKIAYGIL